MWRVVALCGCMNRLFTDFTVHYFVVFYLIIKCTRRIARELYASTKQETCQGCGWGMILCASCSLRLLFPWHALITHSLWTVKCMNITVKFGCVCLFPCCFTWLCRSNNYNIITVIYFFFGLFCFSVLLISFPLQVMERCMFGT